MAVRTERSADATAIRPFRVEIPEAEIEGLRRRLQATRWPEKERVADETQGVQLATMQELARYWANDYDFGRLETRLSAFRTSSRTSTEWTSTSSMFARRTRTRCR
jgi:Epoxide hydrolase N terminus